MVTLSQNGYGTDLVVTAARIGITHLNYSVGEGAPPEARRSQSANDPLRSALNKGAPARGLIENLLEAARSRRLPLPEIVLWIAASRSPSESQTSECSDLLSRSRATFVIVAQRQPGKLQNKVAPENVKSHFKWTNTLSQDAQWAPQKTALPAVLQRCVVANGHTALNAPDPIRTRKLSSARPG